MINNVTLVGRLTKDPELKYTPSNQAVVSFTLAVNRTFKNANGEREADFISIVIWRKSAENFANWAKKGSLIGITGRIATRNYDDAQGRKVYVTEVVADNFQMLESRTQRDGNTGQATAQTQTAGFNPSNITSNSNGGFTTGNNPTPDFGRNSNPFTDASPIEINDEDLPF
ncbi:single-stranded DNA-binding protein [Pseudolactococcus insecticola]|uniref:Single-stranded DNA-binding protein n=1 Tax=Pseudolactococcus insecticola TaxID=2709158 RepID=A0A6A0BAB0_9LACT|nr:single-stranded DNA-binding protein [Lactococcus insecticola]GFH41401.1 single-stranded DNA-binding protein 2 [Lactococcus insecticola]